MEVGLDLVVEALGFGALVAPLGGEAGHFFGEGFAVVGLGFDADVAAGGEDVSVRADFVERGAFAEAGDVLVLVGALGAAPGVVGVGDAAQLVVAQVAVGAVEHMAEFAGVDKEYFAASVAQLFGRAAAAGEEPEAGGDLGGVEELPGQGDHAVDEVGFDQLLADFVFAGLCGRHRAVGEYEAGQAVGREVVCDVLHPGEVGVARRGRTVAPALVAAQPFAVPLGDIEGRVGEDVIGAEVGEAVVVERIAALDLGVDAADREVHLGQPPGGVVGFLAVDRDVA